MRARCAIMAENYCKVTHIEAVTMLEMADRDILPAVSGYCETLQRRLNLREGRYERETLARLAALTDAAWDARADLQSALARVDDGADEAAACRYRDEVLPAMRALRAAADEMETLMPSRDWPFPTYGDMMFSVK